jgi:hypothetical protein
MTKGEDIPDPDAKSAGHPMRNLADKKFLEGPRPQDRTPKCDTGAPKHKHYMMEHFPAASVEQLSNKKYMTWTDPLVIFILAIGVALLSCRILPTEYALEIGSLLGGLVMVAFLFWPIHKLPNPFLKKLFDDDFDEDEEELEQSWSPKWLGRLLGIPEQDDGLPTETPEDKRCREKEHHTTPVGVRRERYRVIGAS